MKREHHMLPVWFFIGALLTIYGVIILITALSEISHPPNVELAQYHAGIWSGILLIVVGGFYTLRFRPRRNREKKK